MIKIMLIEDHPLTRKGFCTFLEDTGDFSVISQAGTLEEAKGIVWEFNQLLSTDSVPDVIILDILLNGENGLDFFPFLKQSCEERKRAIPKVLVCSMYEEPSRIRTALDLGAAGYVPKSAREAEFLRAVNIVASGETYLSPELSRRLDNLSALRGKFTKREQDVLFLIKQNYTNQHIAKTLGVNIRTVENNISHMYLKTGCATREELLRY